MELNEEQKRYTFSDRFEADGMTFETFGQYVYHDPFGPCKNVKASDR